MYKLVTKVKSVHFNIIGVFSMCFSKCCNVDGCVSLNFKEAYLYLLHHHYDHMQHFRNKHVFIFIIV